MLNESVKPASVLTEEELNKLVSSISKGGIAEKINSIVNSHRTLNSRNAKLVHENDELNAENVKLKEKDEKVAEFMEWAKRIIDSGMGAGILRYNPVQFFIDYHTYLKSLEELK